MNTVTVEFVVFCIVEVYDVKLFGSLTTKLSATVAFKPVESSTRRNCPAYLPTWLTSGLYSVVVEACPLTVMLSLNEYCPVE